MNKKQQKKQLTQKQQVIESEEEADEIIEEEGLQVQEPIEQEDQEDYQEQEEEEDEEEEENSEDLDEENPKKQKFEDSDEEEDGDANPDEQKDKAAQFQKVISADSALIKVKIQEILNILGDFKSLKEGERTRKSYVDELLDYFCQYYDYNKQLMELFSTMFNPNELQNFLEANEQQRVMTIRTNTLKTRRKELAQVLIQRGVNLDSLADWSKVGLKIFDSKIPIGATPEYLAGHYMLQSASSFLPVIALAPQMNERILDMAAAPGGKTTYIAQLMKNTGTIFANDVSKARINVHIYQSNIIKALHFNLQRMGVTNCAISNLDGRKIPKIMKGFDRVLLDAPCTGLGIISRDPSIKANKRELILSAVDCTKKGGYIVYSTCSVSVQENEAVVDYAMRNRFLKIVESNVPIGEPGLIKYKDKSLHPMLKLSKRIYPHIHNLDGFYLVKLQKMENGSRKKDEQKELNKLKEEKKQKLEKRLQRQLHMQKKEEMKKKKQERIQKSEQRAMKLEEKTRKQEKATKLTEETKENEEGNQKPQKPIKAQKATKLNKKIKKNRKQ